MNQTLDETAYTVRRISSELRPGVLDDLGLAAAIGAIVKSCVRGVRRILI